MPSNSNGMSWKRWRWLDKHRSIAWVSPVSGIVIFGATIAFVISLFFIFSNPVKTAGVSTEKLVTFIFFALAALATCVYLCVGYCQMFFIELRQKFIAREVTCAGDVYKLKGYYFKKADFNIAEIDMIEEHHVDRRFGRTIVTMLAWAPQTPTPNYKITLKDGSVFYLPGTLEEVEQLKSQLQADIESNLSSSSAE